MSLLALVLALLLGGVVGVVSGLLGIGGGVLMVPFLYALMAAPEWSGMVVLPEHQATLAHATSLFVIAPTALSGFLSYRKAGVIRWRMIVPLGVAAAVAALLAVQVAIRVPPEWLRAGFGFFLLAVALHITLNGNKGGEEGAPGGVPIRLWVAVLGGGAVGFLSALLGVGGGLVAVPILLYGARMELRQVAAGSIGIVVFSAAAGVLGFVVAGAGVHGLPSGSAGFIHLPVGLALLPGAILAAPLGARINQRLPVATLRRLFAFALLFLGLRLLWTNLPLPGPLFPWGSP